ncbi:hypothetical protein CYMTET_56823, partial [Cymbomonas tetramitiformis]
YGIEGLLMRDLRKFKAMVRANYSVVVLNSGHHDLARPAWQPGRKAELEYQQLLVQGELLKSKAKHPRDMHERTLGSYSNLMKQLARLVEEMRSVDHRLRVVWKTTLANKPFNRMDRTEREVCHSYPQRLDRVTRLNKLAARQMEAAGAEIWDAFALSHHDRRDWFKSRNDVGTGVEKAIQNVFLNMLCSGDETSATSVAARAEQRMAILRKKIRT